MLSLSWACSLISCSLWHVWCWFFSTSLVTYHKHIVVWIKLVFDEGLCNVLVLALQVLESWVGQASIKHTMHHEANCCFVPPPHEYDKNESRITWSNPIISRVLSKGYWKEWCTLLCGWPKDTVHKNAHFQPHGRVPRTWEAMDERVHHGGSIFDKYLLLATPFHRSWRCGCQWSQPKPPQGDQPCQS